MMHIVGRRSEKEVSLCRARKAKLYNMANHLVDMGMHYSCASTARAIISLTDEKGFCKASIEEIKDARNKFFHLLAIPKVSARTVQRHVRELNKKVPWFSKTSKPGGLNEYQVDVLEYSCPSNTSRV